MKDKIRENAPWLLLAAVMTGVDAFSKRWAESTLGSGTSLTVIDGILDLRYAENTGAAFSAFSGATLLLSVLSLAICAVIVVFMFRTPGKSALTSLSLSMILAGGVGNLIDRVTRGYVVDFFEFKFVKFAIFNVADVFITVGAALLFIALLCGGERNDRVDD